MNSVFHPGGPCLIPLRPQPPEQYVCNPDQQKQVVEVQTFAERPANQLLRLSRRALNCILLAPVMRVVKCCNYMSDNRDTADCPHWPQQNSPSSPSTFRQQEPNHDCIAHQRNPDGIQCDGVGVRHCRIDHILDSELEDDNQAIMTKLDFNSDSSPAASSHLQNPDPPNSSE